MATDKAVALLIVDVQRDFCRGGALAVPEGDRVVPVLNELILRLVPKGIPVYASRDWHPAKTTHFQTEGGLWPPHCIAGSRGAEFHPDLRLPPSAAIVTKGDRPGDDGYSAFDGHVESGRRLADDLRARGVTKLVVGGLATDYCVRASVLDACRAGLEVTVVDDGIAAVARRPDDAARAIADMKAAGAAFTPERSIPA